MQRTDGFTQDSREKARSNFSAHCSFSFPLTLSSTDYLLLCVLSSALPSPGLARWQRFLFALVAAAATSLPYVFVFIQPLLLDILQSFFCLSYSAIEVF